MRAAAWSLAFLASLAAAAPGRKIRDYPVAEYGGKKEPHGTADYSAPQHYPAQPSSSSCTEEHEATTPPVYPQSSSRPPVGPGSYTYTFLTNSSSAYGPTGTGKAPSTVTYITTVYTTVCPATATHVNGGSTSLSTYITTSTITATYTSHIVKPTKAPHSYGPGQGWPVGHGHYPETTCTELTTVYTTVCPATITDVHEGTTKVHTYETTSTVTSVYTSTITLGYGGHPGGYVPSQSGPAGGAPSYSNDQPAGSYVPGGWTTFPWGTTWISYSAPGYTKTSTSVEAQPTNSYPGWPSGSLPGYPHASGSETLPGYPIPSGSETWPGYPHPSGSETLPGWPHPSGSPSGSATYPGGSHTGKPSVTGSVTVPTSPGTTSGASYPAGNSTHIPGSTGFISSTKTSTSACTKPTPQYEDESCVPCDGQPGSDPEQYCGYTINDNSYQVTPKTCQTRFYNLVITNTTVSPDGYTRNGLLVNGTMPGPKIEANWGDTVVVRVTNMMANNGTSIHFHGIRQFYTNEMDGVPSVTQCPIAPGDSMTYTFKATNYGTSWYHSHFALQTYEGVFGPLVIHGPAAEQYDEEETIVVQDWSHATADSMYQAAQTVGNAPEHGPRTLDTGLINGMNVFGVDGSANATGQRFVMNVVYGKTYRLRLVNTAIQSTFKFYIDGHKFKVIANDFVPIVPYETNIVNINIGQRYDLIFKADQPIGNYWMRSDNQNACAQIKEATNIKGIVRYLGGLPTIPTSTAYNYTTECVDEPLASLVPIVPINAGVQDDYINKTVVVGPNGASPNLYKWSLSGTTFQSQWGKPTLSQIVKNGSVPDFSGDLAIQVPNLKEWVYVIIDSPIPLPHPIHLHGHDFLVLAQGKGLYNSDVVLNTKNPARRDVALMPWDPVNMTGGHLVLAFETDNPGAWLMHCHIGWHTAMGFALQIVEGLDLIKKQVTNSCGMEDTCKNWSAYTTKFGILVDDSGV